MKSLTAAAMGMSRTAGKLPTLTRSFAAAADLKMTGSVSYLVYLPMPSSIVTLSSCSSLCSVPTYNCLAWLVNAV